MNLDTMGLTPLWVTLLCVTIAIALYTIALCQMMSESGTALSRNSLVSIGSALIMVGFAPWLVVDTGPQGDLMVIIVEVVFAVITLAYAVRARYYYEEERYNRRKSEQYRFEDEQRRREEKSAFGSVIVFPGK